MRKILFSLSLISLLILSQSFKSSKNVYKNPTQTPLSYTNDIAPIIKASCMPCHFPPDGRKEALDNYENVKKNIAEVIERVKLPHDSRKFMPRGKDPLIVNDSLIKVLETWQQQNMPE